MPAGGDLTVRMRPLGSFGSHSLHIRNARYSLRWRRILHDVISVRALQPTGALLAGYDASFLILLKSSSLVESWLDPRLETLKWARC